MYIFAEQTITFFIIYKSITMKLNITAAFFIVLSMLVSTAKAQKTDIYPKPQKIEWGTETAFKNDITFTLTGAEEADQDAVRLFKENFVIGNGAVEVVIGERGDAAVAGYTGLIPEKPEGYCLSVDKEKVVIAGNDGSGTFYGVQSFLKLMSMPDVMSVTISDYPSVPQRGLVEGYYGNPYSEADRMGLLKMFGELKMNVYIYGPKDDVYHKSKWRENYPEPQAQKIKEYVNAAKANKVEFVWAIHPGEDIQWNDADRKNIVNKLKAMCGLGVRTFAVFWDDLWDDDGTHGDEQGELMNYIARELEAAYPDIKPCIICPTQYNRGWSNGVYLPTLGSVMNSDINIMWTGNSVVDMINKNDMEWINGQIKRKAYIWLNYPVSDYCINHLLMGPTYGNDLDIADLMSGFVSNPMEYAEASKVSLFSIGDYTWNMKEYDSDASWKAAIKYIMPENSEAFKFFCENNVDLGPNTHGLRRTDESPEFVAAKKIFEEKLAAGDHAAAYEAVNEQFSKFIATAETLLNAEEAKALTSEIEPWLLCMKYIGERGVAIVEMNKALAEGNPEMFVEQYLKYKESDEAQAALRSRDFAGSLRIATPAVATMHVEPFIKNAVEELVAAYKERYDYRTDIFPAQVIENGTYRIMYNGMYLTNDKPNEASSVPQFKNAIDDIRPQRQEWKITLDPSTKRYKIVNLEDGRYINENGVFTVSDETNPYEAVWHTYDITLLANGKYAIQNGGSAGDKFWRVSGTRIEKSNSNEALPDKYIFDIVPLGGEPKVKLIDDNTVYYIMNNGKFLTNNNIKGSGGNPTFNEVSEPGEAQEWKITVDAKGKNCYKITSNADNRYINEYGVFGTNQYYSDWNAYLLTSLGDKWSLQWTQSAIKNGVQYIIAKDNRLAEAEISRGDSYTLTIIAKDTYTSVNNIDNSTLRHTGGEVAGEKNIDSLAIYSADGKLLREAAGNRISTKGLPKGLYIAVAATEKGTESCRFAVE